MNYINTFLVPATFLTLALTLTTGCSDDNGGLDAEAGPDTTGDGDGDTGDGDTGDGDTGDGDTGDGDTGDGDTGENPDGEGPAPVDLGLDTDLAAAGSYVLLAKTGISNATGSSITGGHLGLSPADSSYLTGFSLVADPSNEYATSFAVIAPGKVYAADYGTPTPANLTAAVLWMETAYTDAAGRGDPDYLNLESGDLGGLTLAPGLYTWGSSVTIPTTVTISGAAADVWIFQISDDLVISAAQSVILSGGARAENIFWQVAGQVTIHENAHFEGIILAQTGVTLQTNASFNGRVYAQSMIALDDNVITAP